MEESWGSYPKIYALGHRATSEINILEGEVCVEEKVDGSQFSFGIFSTSTEHSLEIVQGVHLRAKSKGRELPLEEVNPELDQYGDGNFGPAVRTIMERAHTLTVGWTYRGEVLARPKHNVLTYDRVPEGHIILFDINSEKEGYLTYPEKAAEAERIGFEVVPLLFSGHLSYEMFEALLETPAVLGGNKVEGVVIKPHVIQYGSDKKAVFAKFVSEEFKEKHEATYPGARNPTKGSVVERVVAHLATPARWQKAIQHLRDEGLLENSPRDIGALIAEIKRDVEEEEGAWIAEQMFNEHKQAVMRGVAAGFPQWYKEQLASEAFHGE